MTVSDTPPPVLDHASLTPSSTSVNKGGGTQAFTAKAYDSGNTEISSGVTFTWSVTPVSLGSVSPATGPSTTFTSGVDAGLGSVMVQASFNSITKTASASVTVTEGGTGNGALDHVTLSPTSANVEKGNTQQFTAKAYDVNNSEITSGLTYSWSTNPTTLGSVSPMGTGSTATFTAGTSPQSGSMQVSIVHNAVTKSTSSSIIVTDTVAQIDHVTISVASASIKTGGTEKLIATAYDDNGDVISSGATFTWNVTGDIGSVNPTTGSSVTFTAGSKAGTGSVSVSCVYNSVEKTASLPLTITLAQTQPPSTQQDNMMMYAIIAVILAAVVIGLLVALLVRKKKKPEPQQSFTSSGQPYEQYGTQQYQPYGNDPQVSYPPQGEVQQMPNYPPPQYGQV
jgi:hypothetical protein